MNSFGKADTAVREVYYHPLKAKLRPGDVLLEVGHSIVSQGIKLLDGRFSHAMLYIGNGQVAEAVGGGVILIGIDLILVRQPQDLAVYRMPDGAISGAQLKLIEDAARSRMFSAYDAPGAIQTKFGGRKIQKGRFFCSELVAFAYAEAGIELVEGKRPAQVTPNMLAGVDSRLVSVFDPAPCAKIVPQSAKEGKEYAALLNRHKAMEKRATGKNKECEQNAYKKFKKPIEKALKKGKYTVHSPFAANFGYLVSVLGSADLPNGDALSDRIVEFLDEREYFDLGIQQYAIIIEGCQDAFEAQNVDYISSRFLSLPEKRSARKHWKEQEQSNRAMPFPRAIHLRLAEMYGIMAALAEEYCVIVEEMHQQLQGR